MALNVYTPFTAPGSIERGGFALAQGISSGLTGAADNIAKALEAKKRKADLARNMKKMLQVAYPEQAHDFEVMGLEEMQGVVQGEAMKAAMAQRKQQADEIAQRMAIAKHVDDLRMQQEAGTKAMGKRLDELTVPQSDSPELGDFYENPENYPAGRPTALPVTGERVMRAASETGQIMNPQLDNILTALERGNRLRGATGAPETHELPGGYVGYTLPGTGQFSVHPNLEKMDMRQMEVYSDDGRLLGYNIPNGKGGFTFRTDKPAVTGKLAPVLDPTTGQPVPGFGVDASGKVHDVRTVLQKSGVSTSTKAAPSTPAGGKRYRFVPGKGLVEIK
jgi:hypothetical protein